MAIQLGTAQTNPGLTFGGTNNDNGYSLCVTEDNGYLLAGSTRSFSQNADDIYLIKLSSLGQPVWFKTMGGRHQDFARSIIKTHTGFVIVGDVWDGGDPRTSMYMCQIDQEGNKLWDNQFGTNYDEKGLDVIESENGDFLILGYSRGIDLAGDIFLVRTDASGNEIWRQNYGYDYDDYAIEITENEDGSLMIVGTKAGFFNDVLESYQEHDADILIIKVDVDGNEIWRKLFGLSGHDFGYSIKKAPLGGYYIFGSTQSYGAGSFDMLLIKINEQGEEIWHKTYGGLDYEYGISMDISQTNEIYLFGTTKSFGTNESADFYLIKTDENGEVIWENIMGGEMSDFGQAVVSTSDSGCVVLGSSQSYGSGMSDVFFIKISKDGQIENLIDRIDTIYENQLVVAPNPMHGTGHIIINEPIFGTLRIVELRSIDGKLARKYTLTEPNLSFDVSTLPAAMYVYKIYTSDPNTPIFRGKLIVN